MKQYVIVFFPRVYEFSIPSPPRIVYGPAPKDWCENEKRNYEHDGASIGGHYAIREAEMTVDFK